MKKRDLLAGIAILGTTSFAENKLLENIKLDETIITAERYEETPIIETSRNATIITGEEIKKRGYRDVSEALKMVPGLFEVDGSFSLRGQIPKLADKNLVILLDGIPQNGMDNRAYDLDFIPIDQVEKIEILPSGGAIMYGGFATSGVVNIVTKRTGNKKYWENIGTEIGSYNYRKYKVNYGMNLTKRLSTEINYLTKDKDGYRDGEKNDLDFIEWKSCYKLDNGFIEAKYSHIKKVANDRLVGLTKKEYEENRRKNSAEGRYGTEKQDKYVALLKKELNDTLEFSSVIEYKDRDYKYNYPAKNGVPAYKKREKETDSIYMNAQLKQLYGKENSIIFGGDYSKAKVKESIWSSGKKSKKIYYSGLNKIDYYAIGGYLQNRFKWEKFIFSQGVRLEKNSFNESSWEYTEKGKKTFEKSKDSPTNIDYELSNIYKVSDSTSYYLNYNISKRSPSLTEFSSWNNKDEETKNKKAQKIDTLELGIKSLINNIYISGAVFYIKGENEIMYDPKYGAMGGDSFYNLNGNTRRVGVELSSEQYFEKMTLRENVTYMDNEIVDGPYSGNEIPGVPKIMCGIGITYEVTPKFIFNLDTRYFGKALAANDFEDEFGKMKSYTVTDLSLRYEFENGVAIYGGVNNVFNEMYCDYIQMNTTSKGKELKYSPAPERRYIIGIEYNF